MHTDIHEFVLNIILFWVKTYLHTEKKNGLIDTKKIKTLLQMFE